MEPDIEALIECVVIKYYAGEEVTLPVRGMTVPLRDSLWSEISSRLGFKDIKTLTNLENKDVNVFFSYAHKDEHLRDELAMHLSNLRRQKIISEWHDRRISAGTEWAGQIDQHLDSGRIILLLISPAFMSSDYCHDVEMLRAMERHENGEARVIPVILRPCDWKGAPFSKLQALPKDAVAVTLWGNQDEAFLNVVDGIRKAIDDLVSKT